MLGNVSSYHRKKYPIHYTTLQYTILQYSTVQYSTVQYSTVQYSAVQYSAVQYSSTTVSTVQYSTVQYSKVQYSTVQYSTVQYSTVQYSTAHACRARVDAERKHLSRTMHPFARQEHAPYTTRHHTCTHRQNQTSPTIHEQYNMLPQMTAARQLPGVLDCRRDYSRAIL